MAETAYAQAMKQVVRELHPLLKAHGFRKQRHTFNRECESGLVQVVNFQMGPFDPPGTEEIPGFRENLYGKFAVNLGVFVAELHASFSQEPRPKFVAEYYCEIRRRLGELMPGEGEYWWSLDADLRDVAEDVRQAFEEHAFPFLDALTSRDRIIREWYRTGDSIGFPPRGALAIALVHWERGEKEVAEKLVRTYLDTDLAPGHRQYVEEVAARLGMSAAA